MHLPVELWQKIIGFATDLDNARRAVFAEHLLPPFSTRSLRAKLDLSMVSHLFRQISVPFLYEAIEVKTRLSLKSLHYALVHSPVAATLSAHVFLLQIKINELSYGDVSTSRYAACILGNTTRLIALEVTLRFDILTYHRRLSSASTDRIQDIVNAVPTSLYHLAWELSHEDEKSVVGARKLISACSHTLRSFVIDYPHYDISRLSGKEFLELQRLTHIYMIYSSNFTGCNGLLGYSWKLPSLTHMRVGNLRLSNPKEDTQIYPRITYLDVGFQIRLKSGDLEVFFPVLETLLCSGEYYNQSWFNTSLEHSALRELVITICQNPETEDPEYSWAEDGGLQAASFQEWNIMRENLRSINLQRLPSLLSIAFRHRVGVLSGNDSRRLVDETMSHLRDAGVIIAMQEAVRACNTNLIRSLRE